MSNQQSRDTDEQLWKAFQYVAGELSARESEVFEQQMLEDVRLCEAVSEAALLTSFVAAARRPQQVQSVPVSAVMRHESGRSYRAVAVITVVCCCVLVALVAASFSQFRDVTTAETVAALPTEAELLVNAWVENSVQDGSLEAEGVDLLPQDLDVPDWLLTAVSLSVVDQPGRPVTPDEG